MKKVIKLNQLVVNPENYRFEPVKDETQAIDLMLEEKGPEILALAKHIGAKGLDMGRDIRVVEIDGKYSVLDGNRRITALKCLHKPTLVKDPALRRGFENVVKITGNPMPKEVNCYIYSSEEVASEWIKLDHTGKNEGVGQDPWGAPETDRFNQRFGGKLSLGMQAVDFLKKEGMSVDTRRLKVSTVNRLLADPEVREYLGVGRKKGVLEIVADKGEATKRLNTTFQEIVGRDLKVNEVYYSDDREKFISRLFPSGKLAPLQPTSAVLGGGPSTATAGGTKGERARSLPVHRRALVPSSCGVKIKHSRLNKIFDELKRIKVEDFENATAVLFRVFLEGSLDHYLVTKKIYIRKNPKHDPSLAEKLKAVGADLKLLPDEQKVINKAIASKDTLVSINTFNAYVHNTKLHPNQRELKNSWDELQTFFERLWGAI